MKKTYKFTTGKPVSLPIQQQSDGSYLVTVGPKSGPYAQQLSKVVRALVEIVPPEAEEITVYKKSEGRWKACCRLSRGWVQSKLATPTTNNGNKHNLERYGIYSIPSVLAKVVFPKKALGVVGKNHFREFDGCLVKMDSLRLRTFALKGTVCVVCGLEGQYFALEKHYTKKSKTVSPKSQGFHFNLYGLDVAGNEIMFTKDHIYPKSKGGPDKLTNLDPMCIVCNNKKADTVDSRKP